MVMIIEDTNKFMSLETFGELVRYISWFLYGVGLSGPMVVEMQCSPPDICVSQGTEAACCYGSRMMLYSLINTRLQTGNTGIHTSLIVVAERLLLLHFALRLYNLSKLFAWWFLFCISCCVSSALLVAGTQIYLTTDFFWRCRQMYALLCNVMILVLPILHNFSGIVILASVNMLALFESLSSLQVCRFHSYFMANVFFSQVLNYIQCYHEDWDVEYGVASHEFVAEVGVITVPVSSLTTFNANEHGRTLATDIDNGLAIFKDELSVSEVITRWVCIGSDYVDAGIGVGPLLDIHVGPQLFVTNIGGERAMGGAGLMASLFDYWYGVMEFKIEFIAPQGVGAVFSLTYEPNGSEYFVKDFERRMLINLRQTDCVYTKVNWHSGKGILETGKELTPIVDPTLGTAYSQQYHNGTLRLSLEVPVMVVGTRDVGVSVVIWARANEKMVFFKFNPKLSDYKIEGSDTIVNDSSSCSLIGQSDDVTCGSLRTIGPTSFPTPHPTVDLSSFTLSPTSGVDVDQPTIGPSSSLWSLFPSVFSIKPTLNKAPKPPPCAPVECSIDSQLVPMHLPGVACRSTGQLIPSVDGVKLVGSSNIEVLAMVSDSDFNGVVTFHTPSGSIVSTNFVVPAGLITRQFVFITVVPPMPDLEVVDILTQVVEGVDFTTIDCVNLEIYQDVGFWSKVTLTPVDLPLLDGSFIKVVQLYRQLHVVFGVEIPCFLGAYPVLIQGIGRLLQGSGYTFDETSYVTSEIMLLYPESDFLGGRFNLFTGNTRGYDGCSIARVGFFSQTPKCSLQPSLTPQSGHPTIVSSLMPSVTSKTNPPSRSLTSLPSFTCKCELGGALVLHMLPGVFSSSEITFLEPVLGMSSVHVHGPGDIKVLAFDCGYTYKAEMNCQDLSGVDFIVEFDVVSSVRTNEFVQVVVHIPQECYLVDYGVILPEGLSVGSVSADSMKFYYNNSGGFDPRTMSLVNLPLVSGGVVVCASMYRQVITFAGTLLPCMVGNYPISIVGIGRLYSKQPSGSLYKVFEHIDHITVDTLMLDSMGSYFGLKAYLQTGTLKSYDGASLAKVYWLQSGSMCAPNVTVAPSKRQSFRPAISPTVQPSFQGPQPTLKPILKSTKYPTLGPSERPTRKPTFNPTKQPTPRPSFSPTRQPTPRPSLRPTNWPTLRPTSHPTGQPTARPTRHPTVKPSSRPTVKPTNRPTRLPTPLPTSSTCVMNLLEFDGSVCSLWESGYGPMNWAFGSGYRAWMPAAYNHYPTSNCSVTFITKTYSSPVVGTIRYSYVSSGSTIVATQDYTIPAYSPSFSTAGSGWTTMTVNLPAVPGDVTIQSAQILHDDAVKLFKIQAAQIMISDGTNTLPATLEVRTSQYGGYTYNCAKVPPGWYVVFPSFNYGHCSSKHNKAFQFIGSGTILLNGLLMANIPYLQHTVNWTFSGSLKITPGDSNPVYIYYIGLYAVAQV